VTTIHLFVLHVLHGNTACAHLPHPSGMTFSDSAYCQARAPLPSPSSRRSCGASWRPASP
jgi:hypothetical protein